MIEVHEAEKIFSAHMPKWHSNSEVIKADRDYPPIDRVMMDGIAINYDHYQQGLREFKVEGVCAAGDKVKKLQNQKNCLEVMTGAPLPENTNLIIPYEHLELKNNSYIIKVNCERFYLENIHKKGSDCIYQDVIIDAGKLMNGPRAGILASFGLDPNTIFKTPKILLISTGDELVAIEKKPLNHQLRRSNVYALATSLKVNGFTYVTTHHVSDNPRVIADHYEQNVCDYDLLIYSGGVSKGKFDYLPNIWSDQGVTKYFHEVRQRPGKPLWFGEDKKNKTFILGLPGNPVSSLVCLHRYFIPSKKIFVKLTQDVVFKKDLTLFAPVKISSDLNGILSATPLPIQNSGEFVSLAQSDGFVELPAKQEIFKAGEVFSYYSWRNI